MEAVELAIPKLMGSEVLVGARVCSADGESASVSPFSAPKIDECTSVLSHRGTSGASESSSWIKKTDAELCKNGLVSRIAKDVPQGLDHGGASSSIVLLQGTEGKHIQRKVVKVPRNVSGSFKKLRMLQTDNLLPQAEADNTKMESDKLGSHLVKCSSADKSAAVKQKTSMNGRRADRRNYKVPMKGKYDPFSPKAGLLSFSPASGVGNTFGRYGLKPDAHDITKLMDEISLHELLDGSYRCPTQCKEKGKKVANVNENILESVRKACSSLQLRGLQQGKQTEEVEILASKKIPLLASPSNTSAANGSDGDESSSLTAGLSKCSKDQESCIEAEALADMTNSPLYQPRDILERLALPPSKELDSLLQDAVTPTAFGKLTDSRSVKPISHLHSLPPFPWSNNFNGHYKSSNDAMRLSNRSTCQGRWVRIRSTASFIGGGNEGFVDLDLLTYDDSLVPAGQLRYRLPEIEKTPSTFLSQHCCQEDVSLAAGSMASLPPNGKKSGFLKECASSSNSKTNSSHSPTVLAAAQTLCDIASYAMKHKLNRIMKWPKQPSQKAMKACKSQSSEKPEEGFQSPKPTLIDHIARGSEYGSSSSKKPKISLVDGREDVSHVQAVIGLSSVSGPRSSRSSPSRLPRDSVAEARHSNGGGPTKPSFMVPPPHPRVLDRSNHNPPKVRKLAPMDWSRTRS